jgi:hypothetical protein
MPLEEAQEYDARLRWWRIHCVATVSLVPLLVVAAILEHEATALPIGLVLALAAHASTKAGRTLLPRHDEPLRADSQLADFPDGDAVDGSAGAGLIILTFAGLGIAAYGGYVLVCSVLALG